MHSKPCDRVVVDIKWLVVTSINQQIHKKIILTKERFQRVGLYKSGIFRPKTAVIRLVNQQRVASYYIG